MTESKVTTRYNADPDRLNVNNDDAPRNGRHVERSYWTGEVRYDCDYQDGVITKVHKACDEDGWDCLLVEGATNNKVWTVAGAWDREKGCYVPRHVCLRLTPKSRWVTLPSLSTDPSILRVETAVVEAIVDVKSKEYEGGEDETVYIPTTGQWAEPTADTLTLRVGATVHIDAFNPDPNVADGKGLYAYGYRVHCRSRYPGPGKQFTQSNR